MARSARGQGTIRKKTVKKNGREYTYWEGRYTSGYDPGTGRQIQRSISGRTQQEVAKKLKAATAAIDSGTYTEPSKMTVAQWLDIWKKDYLKGVKPYTVDSYTAAIRNHIKPALGAVRLEALNAHTIQQFYNRLGEPTKQRKALSPKTIKNVHGVLHKALQQAVKIGYLRFNPAEACELPRVVKKEMKVLDEDHTKAFMQALKGDPLENLFLTDLFTGLRQGALLGITWDCIDFASGLITIKHQLQQTQVKGDYSYHFSPLKNDRPRTITPAAYVMQLLKSQHTHQLEMRLRAGELWYNEFDLVFTNEVGRPLSRRTIYKHFKRIAAAIGVPDLRFHDLRHSYAVASIRGGDDIKTIQTNLGHATAAFTLDVYGHATDQMKRASAARMDAYIKSLSGS